MALFESRLDQSSDSAYMARMKQVSNIKGKFTHQFASFSPG